jgi:hypothetical protein
METISKAAQSRRKTPETESLQPNPKRFVPSPNFAGKWKRILQPRMVLMQLCKTAYCVPTIIHSCKMNCIVNLKE